MPLVNNVKLGLTFGALAGVKGRAHLEVEQSEKEGRVKERNSEDRTRDERKLERKREEEEISDLKKRVGKKVNTICNKALTLRNLCSSSLSIFIYTGFRCVF